MEDPTVYTCRQIAITLLERVSETNSALALADLLRARDPAFVQELSRMIEVAESAWSREFHAVFVRQDGFHYAIKPTLIRDDPTEPLVKLSWGLGDPPLSLTTSAEFAWELALDIMALFPGPNGIPQRPQRPPEPEQPEPRGMQVLHELAIALAQCAGFEAGCSIGEVDSWVADGKPAVPRKHDYLDYPADKLRICGMCGYYVMDGDLEERVCSGKPLTARTVFRNIGVDSIHARDPRRSPDLREAERLAVLVGAMRDCGAREVELADFEDRLCAVSSRLSDGDKERFSRRFGEAG